MGKRKEMARGLDSTVYDGTYVAAGRTQDSAKICFAIKACSSLPNRIIFNRISTVVWVHIKCYTS
jgi:hypothetical protein